MEPPSAHGPEESDVSPATPALPELANFVAGRRTGAADGRTSDVIDPTTGEAYVRAPVSGPAS